DQEVRRGKRINDFFNEHFVSSSPRSIVALRFRRRGGCARSEWPSGIPPREAIRRSGERKSATTLPHRRIVHPTRRIAHRWRYSRAECRLASEALIPDLRVQQMVWHEPCYCPP